MAEVLQLHLINSSTRAASSEGSQEEEIYWEKHESSIDYTAKQQQLAISGAKSMPIAQDLLFEPKANN